MDIRNFFGEKKGVNAVATTAAVVEDIPKLLRRKTIVNDDDSDTESPSELVSTSTETLTTKSESSKSPARPSVKLTAKPSAKATAKPSAKPSALFQPAKSKQPVVESVTVGAAVAVAVVASAQPSSLSPVATIVASSPSASSSTVSNGKIDGPDETTVSTSELPADIETKVVDAVVASVKSKGVGLTAVSTDFSDIITWKAGESIPYLALVNTFEAISKISGRLEKETFFCRLFRAIISTTPSELDAIVHLASNSVGPAYEGLELGIGDSLLVKAVCEATGRKKDAVEEDYEREGDLGTVALLSRNSQKTLSFAAKPKPLHAIHVLEMLRAITRTKGERAQGRKVDIIKGIMVKCQGSEAKYIVRALQGKLRIGTAEQTVLVALAHSFALSSYSGPKSSTSMPSSVSVAVKGKAPHNEDEEDEEGGEDENENEEENEDEVEVDKKNGKSNKSEKQKIKELSRDQEVTICNNTDKTLLQLVDEATESEPAESEKLRKGEPQDVTGGTINTALKSSSGKLTKEVKCELAVIAVKRAFSQCPNLSLLIKALLTQPLHLLYESCRLMPGVPVAPMLAKPTKEVKEVLTRLSGLAFTMEYKYDGERAQVHLLPDGSVKIFSRNSEDNSEKYPDLKDVVKRARNAGLESCVLDAEVVAYDREKNCLLSFQVLSTRKRKVEDGDEDNQKVKVVLQLFDILYINGKSLLQQSLRKRRDILKASFTEEEGFLYFASGADHVEDGDTAPIESMMSDACGAMCEGLMVKTLDLNASYEPSRRSLNWLKLKKDYIDGMGVCDSVDLVVIGGYLGRGKRVNCYGAYLMACYDSEADEFQSVCKVGTGFKDGDLTRLTEQLRPSLLGSNKRPINYNVGDPLTPDHWFEATYVWELQAADLSKSNVHKGGIGRLDDRQRGIGLRFPRFIRERTDKKPENATSSEQIVDMYISQGNDLDNTGAVKEEDDDDDLGI